MIVYLLYQTQEDTIPIQLIYTKVKTMAPILPLQQLTPAGLDGVLEN